jgi:hypothetical protein
MKITLRNRRKKPVFCQYQGQCSVQPAYLEFDPAREGELELTADYSGDIGNGVPADVWNKKILRFAIPAWTTAKVLKELRCDARLARMLEQVREEYEVVWNGNNYVGRVDNDMQYFVEGYIQERVGWLEAS